MRRCSVALLTLVLSNAVAAQPQAPPSTSGRLVRMDVFATDARGRAIEDLKSGDFELREEGNAQTIEAARFVPVAPGGDGGPVVIQSSTDERAAAARQGVRLFALFLDEYHVPPGATADRAREALTRFVDRDLTAHDLVVVMKPLDSLFAIRMTADRDAVRREIASFEGRKGDYQPRNSYE